MSKRIKYNHVDKETHLRHLRRQLESLEKDNHSSLNDVEGLIHIALDTQEEEGPMRKLRKSRMNNNYKTSVSALLEESGDVFMSCQVKPSLYPPRHFCSVCGYPSVYTCIKCGMKYCSTSCLGTHRETRCLKWTA